MCNMLFLALSLVLVAAGTVCGQQTVIRPINLTLCKETNENVSRFMTDVYVLQPQQQESCSLGNTSTPVMFRVTTTAPMANLSTPVVFTARSERYVQTWRIPLELPQISQLFYTVERILCSVPPSPLSEWVEGEVIIDVFTSSTGVEDYTIEVTPVEDTVLRLDSEVQLEISTNSPAVRYFEFPSSISSVVIKATADFNISDGCIVVSAKKATCPVDVIHQNVLSNGVYQTMLTRAAVPVTAERIGGSFFLVLLVTNSTFCDSEYNSQDSFGRYNNIHTVNVTVTKLNETGMYFILGILVPPFLFGLLGLIAIVSIGCLHNSFENKNWRSGCNIVKLLCCNCKKYYEAYKKCKNDRSNSNNEDGHAPTQQRRISSYLCAIIKVAMQTGNETNQPMDDDDVDDPLAKGDCKLKVSHLMKKTTAEDLNKHYRAYGWIALIAGTFYGLPAIQFVLGQQLSFLDNGNQDICYYNFECVHPWGVVTAFNNVWSNIGYVILGVAFIVIVAIRHYKTSCCCKKIEIKKIKLSCNEQVRLIDEQDGRTCCRCYYPGEASTRDWDKGVPQFYGIFYAMGVALIAEGFMSALYHVCPSDLNFQFDTAFMFIIGGLLTVKVLQSRHPDINALAYVAFFCFGIVVFMTLIGIYTSRSIGLQWIKIVLIVTLMAATLIFFMSFCNHHRLKTMFIKGITWLCKKAGYEPSTPADQLLEVAEGAGPDESPPSTADDPQTINRQLPPPQEHKQTTLHEMKHFCQRYPIRLSKFLITTTVIAVVGVGLLIAGFNMPDTVLYLFIVTTISVLGFYLFFKCCVYREPCTLVAYLTLLVMLPCFLAAVRIFLIGVTDKTKTPSESRGMNQPCLNDTFYDWHDLWHFLSACAMFLSFLFLLTLDDGMRDKPTNEIPVF